MNPDDPDDPDGPRCTGAGDHAQVQSIPPMLTTQPCWSPSISYLSIYLSIYPSLPKLTHITSRARITFSMGYYK